MLVKSNNGFMNNLWVAPEGHFDDKQQLYIKEHEDNESDSQSSKTQSSESGNETPNSQER